MADARVVVDFVANTAALSSGLRDVGSQSDGAGKRMKGMGKAALLAGGAAGLGALVSVTKMGIDELAESSKVSAQTTAAIKSTGGAAGVTAKQVEDYAGALSEKTGMDDEAIQSGENLLLTFTNVQNQVGKGNDIFNQATNIMADMSQALGQDTKSSAIQLGKALNDPIKGITALGRVGVSFTEGQKKTIKTMVKNGDTMGAQKLILKELNKEFGGSAKAYGDTMPGQVSKLQNSFGNLAGEILGVLVPAFSAITKFVTEHPRLFKALVIGVLALAAAMVVMNAAMAVTAIVTAPLSGTVLLIVAGLAALVAVVILTIKYWDQIMGVFKTAFDWLKANWPLLLPILLGPIGIAALAIIKYWDDIKRMTIRVWSAVKTAISTAVNAVANVIKSVWNGIMAFLEAIGGRIAGAFETVRSWLKRPAEWAQDAAGGIRSAWNGVIGFLGGLGTRIFNALDTVRTWLKKPGEWAEDAKDAVVTAFNAIVGAARNLGANLLAPLQTVANILKAPINAIINGINAIKVTAKFAGKKLPGPIPDIPGFNFTFDPFPGNIPLLARGGVISSPTLAMVGEGAGREIVAPESLLRDIVAGGAPQVRVYLGDQELRSMVRYEVRTENDRVARVLLGGLR